MSITLLEENAVTAAPARRVPTRLPRIEPWKIKAIEPLPITTPADRERALAHAGYNLFRLPSRLVTIDLLTDSGVAAMSARQWAALMDADESYAGSDSFTRLEEVVRRVTGYAEVIPAHQGRAAERLLFEALVRPGDVVPGNTHFDTTRANLERRGAQALDLPVPEALQPAHDVPFKGDIDLAALTRVLGSGARVPLVLMTITSNACGGQPVSPANLAAVRRLCIAHGVPLFLDAARFAENARLVSERDASFAGSAPHDVARALFAMADGCVMSAKKDALVHIGGFIALQDHDLAERIRADMVVTEGFPTYGGLAGRDLAAIAVGLEDVLDARYLDDRIAQLRAFGDALHAMGVPTVRPPGGHAIYIDSRAFAPHLDPLDFPGHAIACALYVRAGVRGTEVGQLMRGSPGADGREEPVPLDLVRLAVPRRVYTCCHLDYVAAAVGQVYERARELPAYAIVEQPRALRHFTARLAPRP